MTTTVDDKTRRFSLPALGVQSILLPHHWELVALESTFESAIARFVPIDIGNETTALAQLVLLWSSSNSLLSAEGGTGATTFRTELLHHVASASIGPLAAELWLHRNESDSGAKAVDMLDAILKTVEFSTDPVRVYYVLRSKATRCALSLPRTLTGSSMRVATSVAAIGDERRRAVVEALGSLEVFVSSGDEGSFVAIVAIPLAPRLHTVGSVVTYKRTVESRAARIEKCDAKFASPEDSVATDGDDVALGRLATLQCGSRAHAVILQPFLGTQYGLAVVAHDLPTARAVAASARPLSERLGLTGVLCIADTVAGRSVRVPLSQLPSDFVVDTRPAPLSLAAKSTCRIPGGAISFVVDGRSAAEFAEFIAAEAVASGVAAEDVKCRGGTAVDVVSTGGSRRYVVYEAPRFPGTLLVVETDAAAPAAWTATVAETFTADLRLPPLPN